MATATRTRPNETATREGVRPYLLSVRQYLKMIEAGVFPEDARVELLGGVLAEKMTKYTPHNITVDLLGEAFRHVLHRDWILREEKSVVMGMNWRPEPDLAVARGPRTRYRKKDPTAADLALVVEVADSSKDADSGVKWHGYAAFKIPVYWVVNIPGRTVEVSTNPVGRGKTAKYRDVMVYDEGDSVPVVIAGQNLGTIAVKDFLP